MAAFAGVFDERTTRVDDNSRMRLLQGADDGGISLNSADDGPPPDADDSDDSSFHMASDLDDDDDDEHPPSHDASSSHRHPSRPASDVGASDDNDDDDDNDENMSPAVQRVQRAVARHIEQLPQLPPRAPPENPDEINYDDDDPADCPLCWEEQPHLNDSAMQTAMAGRMSDFRRIIFRFERMMAGRQADAVIFRGMLELRRLYVERDLERYSDNRFQRWTLAMLQRHYSPLSGHRFDVMRELGEELRQLSRQKRWIMEHAMFVVHPESGARIFNIRAVETYTRVSREYSRLLDQKRSELQRRNATSASDSNMVLQAIQNASSVDTSARKRQRRGVTAAPSAGGASQMYEVGGL